MFTNPRSNNESLNNKIKTQKRKRKFRPINKYIIILVNILGKEHYNNISLRSTMLETLFLCKYTIEVQHNLLALLRSLYYDSLATLDMHTSHIENTDNDLLDT